jgi:AcrR family transcriptional regulator
MRKLADAVGVTAPALFRHYGGKEEVLLDVMGEAHSDLMGYLTRARQGQTPLERFSLAGAAYLDFALENPRWFKMIYAFAEFIGLEELPEEVSRRTCAVQQFWHDRVRECVDAGLLRAEAPEVIGLTLWAHAYGLISLYLKGMLGMPEEAFRQAYRDSFRRIFVGLGTARLGEAMSADGTDGDGSRNPEHEDPVGGSGGEPETSVENIW